MATHTPKVERRDERFAEKASTRIWKEVPSAENAYISQRSLCHGYDLTELMRTKGFADMIYLLMRGELPTAEQRKLLEMLMVGLCNPGPRHPATRAAVNAGIGKTDTSHILPVAMSIMSGAHLGSGEVRESMRFIRRHRNKTPEEVVERLVAVDELPVEGDYHIAPGFGTRFGGIDIMSARIASKLLELNAASKGLNWGAGFAEKLRSYGYGWLTTGVAAAALLDLGFHPRVGSGLFQLLSAPGLLAHGLEFAAKPITAMPFVDEDHYLIDEPT